MTELGGPVRRHVAILAVSAAGVLPEILGYLAAGLLLGPAFTGMLGEIDALRFMAELGIILLMFSVRLEFAPERIWSARRHVFLTGGCEVLFVGGCAAAAGVAIGFQPAAAILVGAAVAMSSTAVTLKQLRDLDRLASRSGRLAVGVLLFQDVATLPFLIMARGGADSPQSELAWEVAIRVATAVAFAAVLILSRPALRKALAWVGTHGAGEPFLLTALLCVLGTSFAAQALGLSGPIGAFLAGMAISGSDFRHRFEDDIRPFRDLFLGIFFVTVGLQLDLAALTSAPQLVVLWTVILVPVKAVIVAVIARTTGEAASVAVGSGAMLAHGGEFGLLLLTVGMGSGLLMPGTAQPVLAAIGLTMAAAPILIRVGVRVHPSARKHGPDPRWM